MTTAASTPPPSPTSRIPCLAIAGAIGCAVLCIGLVIFAAAGYVFFRTKPVFPLAQAGPSVSLTPLAIPTLGAPRPSVAPAAVPRTPAKAPALGEKDPYAAVSWETFRGVHLSLSVAYPSDWTVNNDNESNGIVIFLSPDQAAAASVISLPAGPLSVDQALDRINNQILSRNGPVTLISKVQNADASITEELEYTSVPLGGTVHSFARLLREADKYYLALFDAQVEEYSRFASVGKRFVESLNVSQ